MMWAHLNTLHLSDVCTGWPGLWLYIWVQIGHVVIGAIIAALASSQRLRWGAYLIAGVWIAKEVASDLPNCDWAWWVGLDSAADLGVAGLGCWGALRLSPRLRAKRFTKCPAHPRLDAELNPNTPIQSNAKCGSRCGNENSE